MLVNNQSVSVGQNAYSIFGADYDPGQFWSDVIQLWFDEAKNFKYGVGSISGFYFNSGLAMNVYCLI